MSNIKFKIAAKTNVGLVRTNNEDNLQAACDLTTAPMKWVNNQECTLGAKGALLVVADGMGGMNAGEVASEIAVNTIKDFFAPEKITDDVLLSKSTIDSFMKKAIVEADKNIKKAAKENPEHRGMGTTIVIGWLLDGKLYVAWCGDSRAYIFNKINGLRQISKDHSYVQTLVDSGKISHDDAFDYPDSNIITRCLSDSEQKARPDTISSPITICDEDIVLLCTDGLCGMIRDHEIEQVLIENLTDMNTCSDELIKAACEASGQDNITVALLKVISGGATASREIRKNRLSNTLSFATNNYRHIISKWLKIIAKIVAFVAIIAVAYGVGYNMGVKSVKPFPINPDEDKTDSIGEGSLPGSQIITLQAKDGWPIDSVLNHQEIVKLTESGCQIDTIFDATHNCLLSVRKNGILEDERGRDFKFYEPSAVIVTLSLSK